MKRIDCADLVLYFLGIFMFKLGDLKYTKVYGVNHIYRPAPRIK